MTYYYCSFKNKNNLGKDRAIGYLSEIVDDHIIEKLKNPNLTKEEFKAIEYFLHRIIDCFIKILNASIDNQDYETFSKVNKALLEMLTYYNPNGGLWKKEYEIKNKIESGELKIIPESRKNETLAIADSGVSDFSITREGLKWGIPFPYDKNQTIYVWADALINYATVLDYPDGENFKKFWPVDLHIIGAEINKFHSIYWPAMLMSAGLALPKEIFIHGLFTVNGQKMSKSLGNVIDPIDVADKFGSDAVRYLLLSQFPASEHGDVKADDFANKYNSDLANGVGNLLERSFTMMIDFCGGIIDEKKGVEEKITLLAEKTEKSYENNFENYKLYEALAEVFSFIKNLDRYINDEKPWSLNKNKDEKLDVVLNTLLFGIEKIIVWLEPFMPNKMNEAKNYLDKLKKGDLKKGEKLGLFPRI